MGELTVRISEAGLSFTASNEGFFAVVSNDNGRPVIGHGHDVQPGETFPQPMTRLQAWQLLSEDFAIRYEPAVNSLVPDTCIQNQFDALCDFAYNEGVGALATLLGHGWDQVTAQMPRWCYEHVNGVLTKSTGLLARREKEVAMFLKEDA